MNCQARTARRWTHGPVPRAHRHQALFYRDVDGYLDGVTRFLEPAIEQAEPIALAVPAAHGQPLASRLRDAGADFELFDMTELGRNPARIMPAVQEMLDDHRGRRLSYVDEPVWPGRSPGEVREAMRHEALINLAWPEAPVRVLCPYDETNLGEDVLLEVQRTHPTLVSDGQERHSHLYAGPGACMAGRQALDPPPWHAMSLSFGGADLAVVRAVAAGRAAGFGLDRERLADLVLAVSELATNSVRHGGGRGTLHVWEEPGAVVCQVEDPGHIRDPLAGRRVPELERAGGLGLWTVNQLCDLVEMRSSPQGTAVRVTMTSA